MSIFFISVILLGGFSQQDENLLEIPLDAKNWSILKSNDFKPLALMESSIIVESKEKGIERLKANGINFKIILDKLSYKSAKKQLSIYIVIPPFWQKSDDAHRFLAKNGMILTEDSYSYLYFTNQDFAESLPSLQYEITRVSLKKITLPETIEKSDFPKIHLQFPYRNAIIDSIIAKITPAEVAQLIRELSGEVPVTIAGQLDTILTRYTLAPKNSSAIRYCHEKLLTYSGLDSVKFHSFTWPPSRTDSNVIATKLGRVYPNRYWIIGGHIDCTSEPTYRMTYAPGADDNATGTVAMMLAAKYLALIPFKYTIRFLAWNAEEFGLYGSAAHAQEALIRNDSIMGVLNGDMIASEATNLDSVRIYTGTRAGSVAIGDTFFNVNADYGIGLGIRRSTSMIANSDHYSYYSRGYNAVCVIENDFCPYYHTIQDRITAPSFDTIFYAKVVKAMVATLATLAEPDTSLRDVGVFVITTPAGIIDSVQIISPACSVYNYGTITENYTTRMKIGSSYNQTVSISEHIPGSYRYVTFPACTAKQRDTNVVSCSTELATDMIHSNDKKVDTLFVRVKDVGILAIISPPSIDTVLPDTVIIPIATFKNFGNTNESSIQVLYQFGSVYNESTLIALNAGQEQSVTFPDWTAPLGTHEIRVYTTLLEDMNPTNDQLIDTIWVIGSSYFDAELVQILSPTGTIDTLPVIPKARVKNNSTYVIDIPTSFHIYKGDSQVYADTQAATGLSIGSTADLVFDTFYITGTDTGDYLDTAKTLLVGDDFPINDNKTGTFRVAFIPSFWGWQPLANLSFGEKPVSKGGALAFFPDSNWIYALKGNNKNSFGRYSIENDAWTPVETMPYALDKKKRPKRGAALLYYEFGLRKCIYATKGNNRLEFWRYGLPGGSDNLGWEPMADIPPGSKRVKGGTGLATIVKNDTLFVLLIKGSKTNEAYLYNPITNTWGSVLTNVPTFDKSAATTGYDDSIVYVICYAKGSKTNTAYRANVIVGSWTKIAEIPLIGSIGRKKKVKEGSALTYAPSHNRLFAFKGGNVKEFFEYTPGDIFKMADDIPLTTKKGVKAGAALTYANGCIYALPGNKLNEFWRYTLATSMVISNPTPFNNEGTMVNKIEPDLFKLTLAPNPAFNIITVSYSLSKAEPVSFKLFDITGSMVKSYTNTNPTKQGVIMIDTKTLASGIYILRFNSGDYRLTRKLVLEK